MFHTCLEPISAGAYKVVGVVAQRQVEQTKNPVPITKQIKIRHVVCQAEPGSVAVLCCCLDAYTTC